MPFGLFGRRGARDAVEAAQAARLKTLVRKTLSLADDAVVAVNEILCADPACPGTETVILVMAPGEKTRAWKAPSAMAELDEAALAALLAAPPAP